ncbi:MAG: 50S ribosomal protein L16 [Methanosarcinales archaeon]|nr:MAG: 50S ribosomal protein L16 [Methanosarcinales archaeon]
MARKPGSMYRNITQRSSTRKEYMGGIPGIKVVQYDMGNLHAEFPVSVSLIVNESCQIRHSALESARIAVNKKMILGAGVQNYHVKLRVYPHEVLRENKQATGAGADRVSQGMRQAFGKAVSTAARVKAGQRVITIETSPQHFLNAKKSLKSAGYKIPSNCSLVVDKGDELVKNI